MPSPSMPLRYAITTLAVVVVACTPADDARGGDVLTDRDGVRDRGVPSPGSIGAPAPAYEALILGGDSTSLESLRGKVVLLNIWATWCHPCRTEIPVLERLHDERSAEGLRVIGVSIDARGEEGRIDAFAESFGLTYQVWHDPDDRVSTIYRAIGVPASYLIDRDGVLRWRKLGPIAENDSSLAAALTQALGSR